MVLRLSARWASATESAVITPTDHRSRDTHDCGEEGKDQQHSLPPPPPQEEAKDGGERHHSCDQEIAVDDWPQTGSHIYW